MATAAATVGASLTTASLGSGFAGGRTQVSLGALPCRGAGGRALLGLKWGGAEGARGGRTVAMARHRVKLLTPEGEVEFHCPIDVRLLDHAEDDDEVEVELPYSCRAGACVSCVGKIVSGTVDQSENSFLSDEQIAEGWVLTCVAYPTSDLVIETHKEEEFNG